MTPLQQSQKLNGLVEIPTIKIQSFDTKQNLIANDETSLDILSDLAIKNRKTENVAGPKSNRDYNFSKILRFVVA